MSDLTEPPEKKPRDFEKEKENKVDPPRKPAPKMGVLSLVRDVDLIFNFSRVTSTYTPDASAIFKTLDLMQQVIATESYYFSREVKRWYSPLLVRWYIGALFYIRTFVVMRANNQRVTSQLRLSLDHWLKEVGLENCPIPGPLVDMFRSISATTFEDSLYAGICPRIVSTFFSDSRCFNVNFADENGFLPGIVNLANALRAELATPGTWDRCLTNSNQVANGGMLVAGNAGQWTFAQPGLRTVPMELGDAPQRRDFMNRQSYFPPTGNGNPARNANVQMYDALALESVEFWHFLIKNMNNYCSRWTGSTTLASIPIECNRAPMIMTTVNTGFANRNHSVQPTPLNFGDLTYESHFPRDQVDTISRKTAILTIPTMHKIMNYHENMINPLIGAAWTWNIDITYQLQNYRGRAGALEDYVKKMFVDRGVK